MTLQNACSRPTSCGFDVVNGVPVQLQHVLGVRLLLLEAAHGKGELEDFDKMVMVTMVMIMMMMVMMMMMNLHMAKVYWETWTRTKYRFFHFFQTVFPIA